MGRPGVTFEEFVQAARPLHEQRVPVTVDRVREVLGRGSRTTLLKHLQKWRQDVADGASTFSLAELPASLMPLIKELWQQAGKEAQAQLAELRQALEHEQVLLRERDQVREGQLKTLAEQLSLAQAREQSTAVELAVAKESLGSALVESQHLRLSLERAEQSRKNLSTKLQEIERLVDEQKRNAAAQLADERKRHDTELARWLQQLDATKQQLRELGERYQRLEKQIPLSAKPRANADKPAAKKAVATAKSKRTRKPVAQNE